MPDHKVTVGNVELISLFDAHGDMDPLQVFPASTMDIWRNEYAEFLDADGHIHPRFGPTAVRSGGKLIVVASAGERGMILGDVAHSPAQAHYTDWSPIFDVDGDLSRKTRHEVLDRLEADGSLVSAGHFPGTGFGRFVRQGNRRVWQVLS